MMISTKMKYKENIDNFIANCNELESLKAIQTISELFQEEDKADVRGRNKTLRECDVLRMLLYLIHGGKIDLAYHALAELCSCEDSERTIDYE